MRRFPFKKIDTFATTRSTGNPAGMISLDNLSDITEAEMQQIARELKGFVSEVGYIAQVSDNGFELRYYSSEREVDFCGHATIAIMYHLLQSNPYLQLFDTLMLKTNRGLLKAKNRIKEEDAVFILSPEPIEVTPVPTFNEVAAALQMEVEALDTTQPLAIINAGLNTLLVPVQTLYAMLRISPDQQTLKRFCLQANIDIIEVFTSQTTDPFSDYRVRVFAPVFGYLEDPATGSGNAAFGYYLLRQKRFDRETLIIEQNSEKEAYNLIKLQRQTEEKEEERILFGGGAIIRIEGNYLIG